MGRNGDADKDLWWVAAPCAIAAARDQSIVAIIGSAVVVARCLQDVVGGTSSPVPAVQRDSGRAAVAERSDGNDDIAAAGAAVTKSCCHSCTRQ